MRGERLRLLAGVGILSLSIACESSPVTPQRPVTTDDDLVFVAGTLKDEVILGSTIFISDPEGTQVREVPVELPTVFAATWTPDRKGITFFGGKQGDAASFGIFNVSRAGGKGTSLPVPDEEGTTSFTWSPEGGRLLISGQDVRIYDISTREAQVVHSGGDFEQDFSTPAGAAWAPMGDRVVFSVLPAEAVFAQGCPRGENAGLFLSSPTGDAVQQLTDGGCDLTPAWSPTGGEIAFAHSLTSREETAIHVISVDGDGLRQISECGDQCDDFAPTWSPDGSSLAFIRDGRIIIADAHRGGEKELPLPKDAYVESVNWG